MNDDTPPPIPTQAPAPLPQPPAQVSMTARWVAWVVASVVMPALPWLTMSGSLNDDGTSVVVMTILALLLQLAASIAVAIGFCKRRAIGIGGAIGMTIVFMLASVAIGTAIWFSVCVARLATE